MLRRRESHSNLPDTMAFKNLFASSFSMFSTSYQVEQHPRQLYCKAFVLTIGHYPQISLVSIQYQENNCSARHSFWYTVYFITADCLWINFLDTLCSDRWLCHPYLPYCSIPEKSLSCFLKINCHFSP